LRNEPPTYAQNDPTLFTILRDFDAAYTLYNDFQRNMERYWCLRWLQQENITQFEVTVIRENLVRLSNLPLVGRISSLPECASNSRAILELTEVDLLELSFNARFVTIIEATPA